MPSKKKKLSPIDNHEIERIMKKLEFMDDQEYATTLLKKFDKATSALGRLLLNQDVQLDHEEWKERCDRAHKEVEQILLEIENA